MHHPPHLPGRATVAVLTGFEPATSGLTGRRALQTAPQDQAVPAGAGPSFAPPTLWEPNRSLGVCNSVWAWLEEVENVRPSLEPALVGADSGAESRGEWSRRTASVDWDRGEHLDDTGSTPLASRDLTEPHTRRDDLRIVESDERKGA